MSASVNPTLAIPRGIGHGPNYFVTIIDECGTQSRAIQEDAAGMDNVGEGKWSELRTQEGSKGRGAQTARFPASVILWDVVDLARARIS